MQTKTLYQDGVLRMEKLVTFWEQLLECVPLMVFACVGCVIQWAKGKRKGGISNLVLSSATAGFGSMCVGFLCSAFPQVPYGVTLFICGMIGYSGGNLVDFMLHATEKKAEEVVGKDIDFGIVK